MILAAPRRTRRLRSLATTLSLAASLVAAPLVATAQPAVADAPEAQSDTAGMTTIAVAALSGYDALLADTDYIGALVGRPGTSKMLEGMLAFFTQGKGLAGVDKSRPIGVVLQTDGAQFMPLACLPVDDLNEVLGLVQGFGIEPLDAGDGVTELELPDRTIYLKPIGAWTYVAQSPAALAAAPADPLPMLHELVAEYDLGVKVMAQNVPPMYRQIALQQMRMGVEQGLKQQPEESDEQFELRREMSEKQLEQLEKMINDLDQLVVGWSIDSSAKKTFFDFSYTLTEGSDLLRQLEGMKDAKTNYAAFHNKDAAFSVLGSVKTPQDVVSEQAEQIKSSINIARQQLATAMEENADDFPDEAARETFQQISNDMLDVFEEIALSGEMDMGGSLTLDGSGPLAIAGGKVPDPAKVESSIKKVFNAAKQRSTEVEIDVALDADSHDDVTFHTMTITIPADVPPQVRDIWGGDEIAVAFGVGPESVYFTLGDGAIEACKTAIDDSAADAGKEILPMEMSFALGQILGFAERCAPEDERAVISMLSASLEDSEGSDHVRMTQRPIDNGVIVRLEAEEGVIKLVGAAAAAAQAQQMKQQQGGEEW
ncbi:hypothetical protein Mal64_12970 [Pseudobythopirellula maris]|uniref:Uncharacterized protein n=1 Tax=Pseudobythopirellula maris TaxID=2527991 RepID=A0A5C5ZV29_9BACT|nr:hypothetical protein [Pseudobythopirellula maris]TWT90898.1 hypothetical protein Mal64_12970 [Pseudobythopirellula maris]